MAKRPEKSFEIEINERFRSFQISLPKTNETMQRAAAMSIK